MTDVAPTPASAWAVQCQAQRLMWMEVGAGPIAYNSMRVYYRTVRQKRDSSVKVTHVARQVDPGTAVACPARGWYRCGRRVDALQLVGRIEPLTG